MHDYNLQWQKCMFLLNLIYTAFGTQYHTVNSVKQKQHSRISVWLYSCGIGSLLPLEYNRTVDLDKSSNTFRNVKESKNVLKPLHHHTYTDWGYVSKS